MVDTDTLVIIKLSAQNNSQASEQGGCTAHGRRERKNGKKIINKKIKNI